ncbi:MAG TPA: hypothetical protein VGV60_17970 [Candidatus Polarisedimenticolia bacterium]|nr:hypothetical protein [Candidatus Polarisedimenticolia bacterium]
MRRHPGVLDGRPVQIAVLSDAGELEEARALGCHLALALAEAGSEAWRSVGFRALPASETACRTVLPAAWPREPAWVARAEDPESRVPGIRPFAPSDLDAVLEIHHEETRGQVLRLDRGRDDWERILEERLARLRRRGEDCPFWVLERRGRVEGYVVLEAAPPTLRWREHGARRGAKDDLVDLFWSALAWARRHNLPRIEGWRMPGVLTLEPLYPASERRRKDGIPMLLPLAPDLTPGEFAREEDCRIFEIDVLGDEAQ